MSGTPFSISLLPYIIAFGGVAVACLVSLLKLREVENPDTRRGLSGLLLASAGWAGAHVVFFVVPVPAIQEAAYTVGLVVGFATVFPWLYFCSAYTGRSLHRQRSYRRLAVAVFGLATVIKVTNPLHHLYFTSTVAATPFTHLSITHGPLHWVAMGLSYALAFVGFFMLFERFAEINYDTGLLGVLVSLTALPFALTFASSFTPALVNITYEPLGVAAFAVGVAFLALDRFRSVQVAGAGDDPTLVITNDGRVHEYNESAAALFPALSRGTIGQPLSAVLPSVAEEVRSGGGRLQLPEHGETQHYQLTVTPVTTSESQLGTLVVFTNITAQERYRRELEEKNERLEQFADVLSHDLRNPIQVARLHLETLQANHPDADEQVEPVERALSRMERLTEELLTIARTGETDLNREELVLSAVAGQAWDCVRTDDAELIVDESESVVVSADRDRLLELFENLFRNAVEHSSTDPASQPQRERERARADGSVQHPGFDLTVTVGGLETGFYVADDGPGIPEQEREEVFTMGYSTRSDGNGLGLGIVAEIADAHGWSVSVSEADTGGARFEFHEYQTADCEDSDPDAPAPT